MCRLGVARKAQSEELDSGGMHMLYNYKRNCEHG